MAYKCHLLCILRVLAVVWVVAQEMVCELTV